MPVSRWIVIAEDSYNDLQRLQRQQQPQAPPPAAQPPPVVHVNRPPAAARGQGTTDRIEVDVTSGLPPRAQQQQQQQQQQPPPPGPGAPPPPRAPPAPRQPAPASPAAAANEQQLQPPPPPPPPAAVVAFPEQQPAEQQEPAAQEPPAEAQGEGLPPPQPNAAAAFPDTPARRRSPIIPYSPEPSPDRRLVPIEQIENEQYPADILNETQPAAEAEERPVPDFRHLAPPPAPADNLTPGQRRLRDWEENQRRLPVRERDRYEQAPPGITQSLYTAIIRRARLGGLDRAGVKNLLARILASDTVSIGSKGHFKFAGKAEESNYSVSDFLRSAFLYSKTPVPIDFYQWLKKEKLLPLVPNWKTLQRGWERMYSLTPSTTET